MAEDKKSFPLLQFFYKMKSAGHELLYIIPALMSRDEGAKIIANVAEILKKENAEIIRHELLWERRLAYPIKQCDTGKYIICYFRVSSDALPRIKQTLRLLTALLRHTVLAHDSVETTMDIFFAYQDALKEKRHAAQHWMREQRTMLPRQYEAHVLPTRIQQEDQKEKTPSEPEKTFEAASSVTEEKPPEETEEATTPVKEPSKEIEISSPAETPKKKRSLADLDQKLDKLLEGDIEL